MTEIEVKEWDEIRKKFSTQTWSLENWKISDKQGFEFYKENIKTWTDQVKSFCNTYPVEAGKFLFFFYSDDFQTKLRLDWKYLFREKENISINDKLTFIVNSYEHSYYYLALLALSCNKESIEQGQVYSKWYDPKKGVNKVNNKNDFWNLDEIPVSGRNWIIKKSPFQQIYSSSLSIWKEIRNAKSHNKIIIEGDEIYINRSNKYVDITSDVDKLVENLISIIELTMHFIYSRVFNHGIFIYPSVIMFYKDDFLPYAKQIDYGRITRVKNPVLTNRPAISRTFDFVIENRNALYKIYYKLKYGRVIESIKENYDELIESKVVLSFNFFSIFTNVDILNSYKENLGLINKMLEKVNLEINESIINSIMSKAVIEGEYISFQSVVLMASKLLNIDVPDQFDEPDRINFDDDKIRQELYDYKLSIIMEATKKEPSIGMIMLYLNLIYKALMPVDYIYKNLRNNSLLK